MQIPKHHILLCASFRAGGEPQGICFKKGGPALVAYLEGELADRGLDDVMISTTSCLKVCDRGPALVVYPEGWWFGAIESEDDIDRVIDAIESGQPEDLLC